MDRLSPWQIRQALVISPPTYEQLDALAAEELATKDRAAVYRIFASVKAGKV